MKFVAEAEVQGGFMQLDARLGQEELPDHFQLNLQLIGIEGLSEDPLEMIGQRALADVKTVRQFLCRKKGLRRGLDQTADLRGQRVRAGGAFSLFLLLQKRAEKQVEKKGKLLLLQVGCAPAFRNDLFKKSPDAGSALAVDQAGKDGGAVLRTLRKGREDFGKKRSGFPRRTGKEGIGRPFRFQRDCVNVHVAVMGGAGGEAEMMPPCGKDQKIVRPELEGIPDGGLSGTGGGGRKLLADLPGAVQHIEKVMLSHHPVRVRRGMDHGDIVGGENPPLLHQLQIYAHF